MPELEVFVTGCGWSKDEAGSKSNTRFIKQTIN